MKETNLQEVVLKDNIAVEAKMEYFEDEYNNQSIVMQ